MPKMRRRVLARYDYEDGCSVEIACTGDIETATALKTAAALLCMKQEELGKQRAPQLLKAASIT